jgi:hypothetical protein
MRKIGGIAVFAIVLFLNMGHASAGVPCENLLVFWQAFTSKILKDDDYALQKHNELSSRLGRPQEFIVRRQIDPKNLRLERRFSDGGEGHRTQLILGYWNEKRVLIKIFWQSPNNLDAEIGGIIIQDYLSEMELAPKVFGMVLDSERIADLKAVRSLPFMVDRHVRSGMYMAVVMEYLPKSFNIPNGRFMPPWYAEIDKEQLDTQIARTEQVYSRLGLKRREGSEYLVTDNGRVFGLDFANDRF